MSPWMLKMDSPCLDKEERNRTARSGSELLVNVYRSDRRSSSPEPYPFPFLPTPSAALYSPGEVDWPRHDVQIHQKRDDFRGQEAVDAVQLQLSTRIEDFRIASLLLPHVHVVDLVEGDAALKVMVGDVVRRCLPKLSDVVGDHLGIFADGLDPQDLISVLPLQPLPDRVPPRLRHVGPIQNSHLPPPVQIADGIVQGTGQELHARGRVLLVGGVEELGGLLVPVLVLAVPGQTEHTRAIVDPPEVPRHLPGDVGLPPCWQSDDANQELSSLHVPRVQKVRLDRETLLVVVLQPPGVRRRADVGAVRVRKV